MKKLRAGLRYLTGREWAMVWTVILAVGTELPALAEALAGDLDAAGDKLTPMGFFTLLVGVIIRSNVWSRFSVQKPAPATPDPTPPPAPLRPVPDLEPEPIEPDRDTWYPPVVRVGDVPQAIVRHAVVPPVRPGPDEAA